MPTCKLGEHVEKINTRFGWNQRLFVRAKVDKLKYSKFKQLVKIRDQTIRKIVINLRQFSKLNGGKIGVRFWKLCHYNSIAIDFLPHAGLLDQGYAKFGKDVEPQVLIRQYLLWFVRNYYIKPQNVPVPG